jgi:prophage tail gpP-like protein
LSTTFKNVVSVLLDGETLRFWSRVTITRALDSIDTVELEAPFDSNDPTHRRLFVPFSYKSFNVAINDQTFFTGTMVPVVPRLTPTASEIAVGAYSLPGVLSETTAPVDSLPLEFKGQNLHEIAAALLAPFDLSVQAQVTPGPVFDKVRLSGEQKILPFLAGLAKQRNQVISSTPTGDLLFWRAFELGSEPVATIRQGESPFIGITSTFNPRQFYSEITGLKSVRPRSKRKTTFTVINKLIPNIFRPYIFNVPDTKDTDLEDAVIAKAGRMYANAISYTVEIATWRDPQGDLWAPNTIIQLVAPGAMIYRPYEFIVRAVVFNKDKEKETAALDVMVPGSFATTAEIGGLPWDE